MMTVEISNDVKKAADILAQMLDKEGPVTLTVVKQNATVRIVDDLKEAPSSLREKLIELEDSLFFSKTGVLYSTLMDIIEKPLLERLLARVEGNQLKAARILGLNRNTVRSRIRKLGIDMRAFKP